MFSFISIQILAKFKLKIIMWNFIWKDVYLRTIILIVSIHAWVHFRYAREHRFLKILLIIQCDWRMWVAFTFSRIFQSLRFLSNSSVFRDSLGTQFWPPGFGSFCPGDVEISVDDDLVWIEVKNKGENVYTIMSMIKNTWYE